MKALLVVIMLWAPPSLASAQEHELYQLQKHLATGDKEALYKLAHYFDSNKIIKENSGHHTSFNTESGIAKLIVNENSSFTTDEINISYTTTGAEFLEFLNRRQNEIVFSELTKTFLITPFQQRDITVKIREISESRKLELTKMSATILTHDWVIRAGIDSLIAKRNPLALRLIASELFYSRARSNYYAFHEVECIALIQHLTGTEFGVPGYKPISWHHETVNSPIASQNLLIYFSKYYADYAWDENHAAFVNPRVTIAKIRVEHLLFEFLCSDTDSIAVHAFLALIECDPRNVADLANEYMEADLSANQHVPPLRLLKQLSALAQYCRANGIDYNGSPLLRSAVANLGKKLSFGERRRQEDKLITTLTTDEITAFEYLVFLNWRSSDLHWSAGRIVDIFYSKHWQNILTDKKAFELYLTKAQLLDRMYMKKFARSSLDVIKYLENYPSSDSAMSAQIHKILAANSNPQTLKKMEYASIENPNQRIKNPWDSLDRLAKKKSQDTDFEMLKVLSKINYEQIPATLKHIEGLKFKYEPDKYSLINYDFGFFLAGDLSRKEERDKFLKLYSTHTEYQLYEYYLDQTGIDYKTPENALDFDEVYDLIKYDVGTGLSGGTKTDREVYSLVKLLELTFNTTLGFPKKLCNSMGFLYCSVDERAAAWMNYLSDNKLLKRAHDEPVSFGYVD